MFENRVLRKIFGTKRDVVTKNWMRWHSEEFCDLHCSPNIKKNEMSRACYMNEEEKCIQLLGWKTRRKEIIWNA